MFKRGIQTSQRVTGYRGKKCSRGPGLLARYILCLVVAFLSALTTVSGQEVVTLGSGMGIVELVEGQGETATEGDIVVIKLKAWLDDGGSPGDLVANTEDFGRPLSFLLGTSRVLPAWNEGVTGMKPGGKRRLFVPHELGVGATGEGQLIPENTDVIFEIELIEIRLQTED